MLEISIHEDADEEIKAAAVYYESLQPGLGEAFLQELARSLAQVQSNPLAWEMFDDPVRRYLLHRFPYGIVYRITSDQIIVLAVMHLRRKPGYWQERDSRSMICKLIQPFPHNDPSLQVRAANFLGLHYSSSSLLRWRW